MESDNLMEHTPNYIKALLTPTTNGLYVDLGDALKRVSKNKRRKAIRYGKPLPPEAETNVSVLVSKAVKDYLNH